MSEGRTLHHHESHHYWNVDACFNADYTELKELLIMYESSLEFYHLSNDNWHEHNEYNGQEAVYEMLDYYWHLFYQISEQFDEINIIDIGCGPSRYHHKEALTTRFGSHVNILEADIYEYDETVTVIDWTNYKNTIHIKGNLIIEINSLFSNPDNNAVRAQQTFDICIEGGFVVAVNLAVSETDSLLAYANSMVRCGFSCVAYDTGVTFSGLQHDVAIFIKVIFIQKIQPLFILIFDNRKVVKESS